LFDAVEPARSSAALATFEPGARSAWHTHPLGQGLIVIFGLGWTHIAIHEALNGTVVEWGEGE
jgi:quercetin dioxygenase-like cupin family protein